MLKLITTQDQGDVQHPYCGVISVLSGYQHPYGGVIKCPEWLSAFLWWSN